MTLDITAPLRTSLRLLRRSFVLLAAASSLAILLSGCGGNSLSTSTSQVRTLNVYVPTSGTAAINAATSTGITLTGINTSLGYGQFSGGGTYALINSGPTTINVSGTGVASTLSTTYTFAPNNVEYTLAVAGQAGQTGALAPQLIVIPNFTAGQLTIPSGSAAIRVVNLSLNADPIGLYNTLAGTPANPVAVNFQSVPYGYSTVSASNAYVAVPTAQLNSFALVDTATPATALSVSSSSNLTTFTFTAGQAYTLYVYGQQGNANQPFTATWAEDYP